MRTSVVLSLGLVASAFILGGYYYQSEAKKVDAAIIEICIQRGGAFYISWNWKPVCTLKGAKP